MRKNKILGAAIAAALTMPMSMVEAATFENNTTVDVSSFSGNVTFNSDDGISTDVDATNGILYATEIFGGATITKLPIRDDNGRMGVVYTLGQSITSDFSMTFTLDNGEFVSTVSDRPKLGENSSNDPTITFDNTSGGSVTFQVGGLSSSAALQTNDELLMLYYINNPSNLATDEGAVKMSVTLLDSDGLPVETGFTGSTALQVAHAAETLTTKLESEDGGNIRISVNDESKKFNSTDADVGTNAYIDPDTARIGYLTIKQDNSGNNAKGTDATTDFDISDTADDNTEDGAIDSATLTITGGQFAASMSTPGKVYLCDTTSATEIGSLNVLASDATTATFDLTNDEVVSITAADSGSGKVGICMDVDKQTEINTVDTPPSATLAIDFVEDPVGDVAIAATPLRQIKKDGTVCLVHAIPNSGISRDKINIRITNTSAIGGKISARMYTEDGTDLGIKVLDGDGYDAGADDGNPETELAPHATLYLNGAILDTDVGFGTWAGRALLELTSTLPNMEVMAMLRHQESKYLWNSSLDSMGSTCSK